MILYGLRGITHGWGRMLSVISPQGAQAVLAHVDPGPNIETVVQEGQPVQYHQGRDGALDELVTRYAIVELDQAAWTQRKQAIGKDAVL